MKVLKKTTKYFSSLELTDLNKAKNLRMQMCTWCKIIVLDILEMFLKMCGFSVGASMYGYCIYRKNESNVLLSTLEKIISKRKYRFFGIGLVLYQNIIIQKLIIGMESQRLDLCQRIELKCSRETWLIKMLALFGCNMVDAMSIIVCLISLLVGKHTSDLWFLPFTVKYNR